MTKIVYELYLIDGDKLNLLDGLVRGSISMDGAATDQEIDFGEGGIPARDWVRVMGGSGTSSTMVQNEGGGRGVGHDVT